MSQDMGVPPAGSGHSPKGGAASSTASPAKPSVPNAADLPTFLRGFSPNALRVGERERIVEAAETIERLRSAISWIIPPFVTEDTPEAELRKRVIYAFEDAEKFL